MHSYSTLSFLLHHSAPRIVMATLFPWTFTKGLWQQELCLSGSIVGFPIFNPGPYSQQGLDIFFSGWMNNWRDTSKDNCVGEVQVELCSWSLEREGTNGRSTGQASLGNWILPERNRRALGNPRAVNVSLLFDLWFRKISFNPLNNLMR